MFLRKFFSALLCLVMTAALSQSIIPRFETIGVNEGLSQSSVYSIYQDNRGFMWFGTADGLNRYDGTNVKVFKLDANKIKQANSNFIRGQLSEDSKGNIWYCNETGIYYYNPIADDIIPAYFFSKEEGWECLFEGIAIDKDNNLWLCNPCVGIFSFNILSKKLVKYPFPTFLEVDRVNYSNVILDRDGFIWFIANLKKGLCYFDTRKHTFQQSNLQTGSYHRRIVLDSLVLLLSYNNFKNHFLDLYSKDMSFKRRIPFATIDEKDFSVVDVHLDYLNRIWITTMSQGVIMFDLTKNQSFQFLQDNSKQKSLPIDYTRCLYEDRQHNLWIGTDGGGVTRLNLKPPKFNLFPLNEGEYPYLKNYFTKCFYEDKKGNLWFSTLFNGICRLNLSTGKIDSVGHTAVGKNVFSTLLTGALFEDGKGRIWAGSSTGVGLYDPDKNDFIPIEIDSLYPLTSYNVFVYQLAGLSDGTLAAATSQGLMHISQHKNGKWKGYFPKKTYTSLYTVTAVHETTPGDLWYASPINGLYHTQYENGNIRFIEKFFANTDLRCIYKDAEDPAILWIGSGIGLIKLNTKTKEHTIFGMEHGLKNSYIYGILEDEQHNLWMSTNGGLSVFNKRTLTFTNYTSKDGLQSNEFNTGAYHKGRSGRFYFGGIKGFNWFHPAGLVSTRGRPTAAISQVWINDVVLKNDSLYFFRNTITLPYFKNDLQFEIAALDFSRPEANKAEYQLKGWDDKAVVSYNKQVRYSNLLPGSYQFTYRVCNADGVWSAPRMVSVIITPPFWKTWWFYLTAIFLFTVFSFYVARAAIQYKYKKQLREMEKQRAIEAERNRISRDMHDEIGSGLTQIALMSELIETQKKADEELKKDVGTISSSARKLVGNMSEIIWALNPQNDSLENLLAYLREQTLAYFEPFNIQYVIQFPDEVPFVKLSNEQRRNLFLVAKEALNNALKHSGADEIRLSMEYKNNTIHFYISDNGKGIGENKIKIASNGLRNMRKRMADIGGIFDLDSGASGCLIHFSLQAAPSTKEGRTTFFTSFKKQP